MLEGNRQPPGKPSDRITMMHRARLAIIGTLCGLTILSSLASTARGEEKGSASAPLFPFVLPWNDSRPGVTNVSNWIDAPAGQFGPITVNDGHLFAGEKRFRILGVNLCFAANFPTHDAVRQIAERMRKFGINCVRFHHMDMLKAPDGIFASDGRTLDRG